MKNKSIFLDGREARTVDRSGQNFLFSPGENQRYEEDKGKVVRRTL